MVKHRPAPEVQRPEVVLGADARIGPHQLDQARGPDRAPVRRDLLLLAAGEDVAPELVARHQPRRRVAHRLEPLQLPSEVRRHLVGRRPRLGRIGRQQQPRLQEGEPGRHHQIVGGELDPEQLRRLDEAEVLLGELAGSRCAGDRPSGSAPAPAAGRAAPRSRRGRRPAPRPPAAPRSYRRRRSPQACAAPPIAASSAASARGSASARPPQRQRRLGPVERRAGERRHRLGDRCHLLRVAVAVQDHVAARRERARRPLTDLACERLHRQVVGHQ